MSYTEVTNGNNVHLIYESSADTQTTGGDGAGFNKHYLGEIDATALPTADVAVGLIHAVRVEVTEDLTGTATLNGTAVSGAGDTAGTVTDTDAITIVDGTTLAWTAVTAGKMKVTLYTRD